MTTTGDEHPAAVTGPWWWQRPRSAVLDASLAALSAAECGLEGMLFARDTGLPPAVGLVFGVLAGSVLILRRRWPVAVVLVGVAVAPAQMGVLIGLVGLYTLAASEVPRRIIGLLAGMSLLATLIVTYVQLRQDLVRSDVEPSAWVLPTVAVGMALGVTTPPILLGLYLGARRRLMESLRERAGSLERELELLADRAEERAEWARSEERTRIAREMHDVVAHRVSLMVVHSAALQAVARKDPEKAVRNAALVGDMGRQALTELREMLGVLRSGDSSAGASLPSAAARFTAAGARAADAGPVAGNAGEPAAVGSSVRRAPGAMPLAPVGAAAAAATAAAVRAVGRAGEGRADEGRAGSADGAGATSSAEGPRLADLEDLLGQSRAAGMSVELQVQGEAPRAYPPDVERTGYRVVQEALTNVHKHAAGARARVRLAHRDGEVAMQVENEAPPSGGTADAGLPSGGNGLVGMKERVSALGGVFVAGPTDAGGFRVSAVLPVS